MSEKTEDKVFDQELSMDELASVSGGSEPNLSEDYWHCSDSNRRDIYGRYWKDGEYQIDGFPHCTATVEDESWCFTNDACYLAAVCYDGMKNCSKAWR